jgi:hypothetical protein
MGTLVVALSGYALTCALVSIALNAPHDAFDKPVTVRDGNELSSAQFFLQLGGN